MVTESLAEGFPRTTDLACTWTITGTQLQIAFAGGGTLVMEFSFAGLSPDRLVLDGFEYQRQSPDAGAAVDVLVVGAGPGGSASGRAARPRGLPRRASWIARPSPATRPARST